MADSVIIGWWENQRPPQKQIFPTPSTPGGRITGIIQVDAFENEDYSTQIELTAFPVEDGSSISDNTVLLPDDLSISGVIGPASVTDTSTAPSITRVVDADRALYDLMTSRQPVSVISGLRVYGNLVITGYKISRNKDNGKSLVFDMTFKQVIIVKSQLAIIPPTILAGSQQLQQQTAASISLGSVNGTPVDKNSNEAAGLGAAIQQASSGNYTGAIKTVGGL